MGCHQCMKVFWTELESTPAVAGYRCTVDYVPRSSRNDASNGSSSGQAFEEEKQHKERSVREREKTSKGRERKMI
jgi:hypothetical protein